MLILFFVLSSCFFVIIMLWFISVSFIYLRDFYFCVCYLNVNDVFQCLLWSIPMLFVYFFVSTLFWFIISWNDVFIYMSFIFDFALIFV